MRILTLIVITHFFMLSLYAQPVIDGNISTAEGYIEVASYTSGRNGFGSQNDMGAIYYTYRGSTNRMYIGITGRLSDNNNIVLFLDFNNYNGRSTGTLGGGTTSTLGVFTTNGTGSCGGSGGLNGAVMDNDFDADYAFAFNEGNTTTNLFCDAMRFSQLGSPPDGYFEQGYIGNTPDQTGTSANLSLPFTGSVGQMVLANRNNYNPPGNTTSGIEFSIPYTALPGTAPLDYVRFFAAITNAEGFFSNETIPGDPGPGNLGCDPNFSNIAGQIFYTNFYVLPFSFIKLNGYAAENKVVLHWDVHDRSAQQFYTVERSNNGSNYYPLLTVDANACQAGCNVTDVNPFKGWNYYRVTMLDQYQRKQISSVLRMYSGEKEKIAVYPNPVVNQQLSLQLHHLEKGVYSLIVTDMDGKSVFRRVWTYDGVTNLQQFELPAGISKGVYTVRIVGQYIKKELRFIIL